MGDTQGSQTISTKLQRIAKQAASKYGTSVMHRPENQGEQGILPGFEREVVPVLVTNISLSTKALEFSRIRAWRSSHITILKILQE